MKTTTISRLCQAGFMAGTLGTSTASYAQQTIRLADDRQVSAQAETEFRFDVKEVPKGKQVRLYLDARIEWGSLGGHTYAMSITVNENGLAGRHLVNKPLDFATRNDEEATWGSETGNTYRLMYSPDFSDRIATDETYVYGLPDTDPFRFVWDITSYVRAGTNSVKIASPQGLSLSLRLRDVGVEIGDPMPAVPRPVQRTESQAEPAPTGPLPVYLPKGPAEVRMLVEASSSGGIRLEIGQRRFTVRSRSSLPEGKWSEGDKAKDVWSQLKQGESVSAKWQETGYSVERKTTLHADHISVADTLANTSAGLVGLIVENRLELAGKPQTTLLAGHVVKRLRQRSSPAHPTAMAQFEDLAIGLAAEDDIFRIHCTAFVEEGAVGLSDPQLGIAPGKAHTLEWSIYMVPNGDYWDFINGIRRNWGSNATLRGPSKWVVPQTVLANAGQVEPWLQKASMVVLCNPVFGTAEERAANIGIQHGTALLLCKAWSEDARNAVRLLKEAAPTVEGFIYLHQNLCTEPGHEQKYQDSRALGVDGKPATTVYSPPPSLFLPTLENSYGKAMVEVYRYIAQTLGANVYIDEITASNVPAYGTYDTTWDGCTVSIDPVSHAVTGKRSSAILLMQPWREALMAYLKSEGKTVIANGPHYTRTMLNWNLQCFVESEPEDNAVIAAHLGHPLCLAQPYNPDALARYTAARRLLDRAGIQFVSFSAAAPMFPITPIELRAGVVIGAERILTNRCGRFGWGDDSLAEAYVFDGQGNRVATPEVKEVRQAGKVMTELRMPSDHLAILVRKRN